MSVEWPFTRLGMKFFEGDVPRLVRALEKIGEGLNRPSPPSLTPLETATVLAALRYWQAHLDDGLHSHDYVFRDIANDEGALVEMDRVQIDALCHKLNQQESK